jgi:hypothetical protein
VMVTAMAGPERRGGPGILTQHATHAAAILAPSRAKGQALPGQEVRAPATSARDRRASLWFLMSMRISTHLGQACVARTALRDRRNSYKILIMRLLE